MRRAKEALWLAMMASAVLWVSEASAQQDLPLAGLSDFQYAGAFRLPSGDFGASSMNYSQGPIAVAADGSTLFVVGHTQDQAIAEFSIPALIEATTLAELNMASDPLQPFATVIDRVSGGNPESMDRIGGMAHLDGQLIVNLYEYYDAPGDNTVTTCVIRDASDLAGSTVDGFYRFPGVAHASGWMSPIPSVWQDALGGPHITGHSSGEPIIGRLSVGPSAFAFDPADLTGAQVPDPVPTVTLLDYSLDQPLHTDLANDALDNDLWTHLSRATYGFLIPGTRTYFTVGGSGGHESGVCYKCTQDDNNLCGGYCSYAAADNYQHYWLYDANDFVAVRNGDMAPHEVRPYEWGEFPTPFQTDMIGGGAFDPTSGLLYLTVQRADTEQGQYANPPVVVAYRIDTASGGGGGGSGGGGGAGAGAGAGGGPSNAAQPTEEGGCGCRSARGDARWPWLLAGLLVLGLRRRRAARADEHPRDAPATRPPR